MAGNVTYRSTTWRLLYDVPSQYARLVVAPPSGRRTKLGLHSTVAPTRPRSTWPSRRKWIWRHRRKWRHAAVAMTSRPVKNWQQSWQHRMTSMRHHQVGWSAFLQSSKTKTIRPTTLKLFVFLLTKWVAGKTLQWQLPAYDVVHLVLISNQLTLS